MPDVFLSYAEEDGDTARRVASLLQAQGWSVRLQQAGDDAEARCMVVLWSRHSVNSDQVAAQAEQGRARHALVPVLLEQVTPPPGLRSIQAADLSGWDGAADAPGARQLVADLAGLLGQPLPSGRVILPPVKVAPRLHPAWLILVALGLLLAAGLGVITLWRNAPPAPSAAAAPLRYADSSAASGAVQPTMPPWARIMDSVAS
ncbi:toll/interleukin-1 receptor domain-containing protein [Noviherbaspirillum sp. 1P10PC]|uniref:toll/interleukin-1 receptor domain-containing protein n=1 Tax=Noviherbaspirillum sp. 1P10PC TaxID=3132292 RepID=UPI0039A3486B